MNGEWVTKTDEGLNEYIQTAYLPKLLELMDEQTKVYEINGGKIECEKKNIVKEIGYKLDAMEVVGTKYTIRVYSDKDSKIADVVNTYTNSKDANEAFLFWKAQMN